MLADSHVHLERYPPSVASAMLTRARRAGVRHFLAIGVDLASSAAVVDMARRRRGILAAVGVHPTRVGRFDLSDALVQLRALACRPGVAAIGEVGLDDTAPDARMSAQEAFFGGCLELAEELDLAVSLHVVGAHRRAQDILKTAPACRAVVHYFQGDPELATAYLALGCYISVGKPATRPDRLSLREAIRHIPLECLLLETDTYPLPGRTTEPRDVAGICRAVAELRSLPYESIARATTANYLRLFGRQ